MFRHKLILFITACLLTLSACSSGTPEKPQPKNSINVAQIMFNSNLSAAGKAEQLAKAAEQLLTVQGFTYANDVANLALMHDAENLRAKLIKAILAPIMAQKGILARIAPLADTDIQFKDEYDRVMAEIETEYPNSTLKIFLLDGQPNIKSEEDVQAYFDSVADGFETLRQFAKSNKDASITMMTSDAFYAIMKKRLEDACIIKEKNPWEWEVECPSPVNMMEVSFSRADFEGLQQIAAGYELYLSIQNSYSLSGALQVAINHRGENQVSPQKLIPELLKDSKFGVLRDGNGFKKIKEMGIDAVTGIRWVIKNKTTLCNWGSANPRNRLGALFNEGLCIRNSSEIVQGLRKADDALAGKNIHSTFQGKYGYQYSTWLNPSSFMSNPIKDLRSLTPLSFNECDHLQGVHDETVGGLFPKADVNSVLKLNSPCW